MDDRLTQLYSWFFLRRCWKEVIALRWGWLLDSLRLSNSRYQGSDYQIVAASVIAISLEKRLVQQLKCSSRMTIAGLTADSTVVLYNSFLDFAISILLTLTQLN